MTLRIRHAGSRLAPMNDAVAHTATARLKESNIPLCRGRPRITKRTKTNQNLPPGAPCGRHHLTAREGGKEGHYWEKITCLIWTPKGSERVSHSLEFRLDAARTRKAQRLRRTDDPRRALRAVLPLTPQSAPHWQILQGGDGETKTDKPVSTCRYNLIFY